MLTKAINVPNAYPALVRTCAFLLLLLPVAYGQYLSSPCPKVFSYRLDQSTNQVFGYVELQNLRIGQLVKLNIDLSIGVAVPQNNVGSITLVKSREQTFRDIYNSQPAQYRVNFPFSNVIPSVLAISVNGQTICTGQKATGQIVTTINLEHTLFTQMQPLSNGNGNNVNAIQFQPGQSFQQTPPPNIYTPQAQTPPQQQQPQFVPNRPPNRQPAVNTRPAVQPTRPRPQPTIPVDTSGGSSEACGMPAATFNRLTINGIRSPKGQFPWAVPIFDTGVPTKPKYICGSTIISRNHLLTAGHCLYNENGKRDANELLTAPGMYNIDNFFETDIQMREVSSFVVHPDYFFDDTGMTEYDIAVMVLREALIYSDLVQPICLWTGSDNLEEIVGTTGLVSGWGVTEDGAAKYPSYVNATVVDKRECRRKLGSIVSNTAPMFCADGHGSVPCTGDSGSGLVIKRGSRFFIRGIVSVGQYDVASLICDRTKYVVYTDIAPFRFWMKKVTQS
ncbi:AGAP001707-PA-like protein [Anopheles sinensis]|uniref:AGAP001707-PA-like protein n=1 Tax=Anopheles sinensis TaxID=74873 RepID=A0A084VI13_ANOSI|nr:AGAP001707-PA-like protein [Anopheles sinensis]